MKQPIKMTPGDELHLTALMAPFSLNLVTGQDRQHLLGYGRAAFVAGHAQLRASTPEAAEDLIEEIIERISDHAVKAMAHQEARKQGNLEQIESARQAIFQAEDCIKRDLRTLASWTDTASAEAEQAAWHAGLDEGRAQAAPAAVAVPDERAAFEAWAKSEDMSIGSDCDGYIHSNTAAASLAWQARAALAATPAAVQTHAEAAAALGINSALTRIRAGNHAKAIEPLEHALRALAATPAAAAPVVLPEPAGLIVENLLALARIVDIAVEDWGESFKDGSMDVKFHSDVVTELESILDHFEGLPEGPDDNVIESGPIKAARILRALLAGVSAPAAMADTPNSFREWFAKNYPADTIILDPDWHAKSIFRMAQAHARLSAPQAQADARDAEQEVLMEHSGCGSNTQVDMLTVRLNPGDKVVMHKGRITQGFDRANRAAIAAAKGE